MLCINHLTVYVSMLPNILRNDLRAFYLLKSESRTVQKVRFRRSTKPKCRKQKKTKKYVPYFDKRTTSNNFHHIPNCSNVSRQIEGYALQTRSSRSNFLFLLFLNFVRDNECNKICTRTCEKEGNYFVSLHMFS